MGRFHYDPSLPPHVWVWLPAIRQESRRETI